MSAQPNQFTRWHLYGLSRRWLPDVRGRARLCSLIKGPAVPASLAGAPIRVDYGPGLQVRVPLGVDRALDNYFFARYEQPVLVPILEAALSPGDVFCDVGANVGIYSLWAAALVGEAGRVYAFEPVPDTAAVLDDLIAQNGLHNIEVVRLAASATANEVHLVVTPNASGISHISTPGRPHPTVPGATAGETMTVSAGSTTLDDFLAARQAPALVKIDVEGHEPEVIAGMAHLLATRQPVVIFESPDHFTNRGYSARITDTLAGHGYRVWSLGRRGLRTFDATDHSKNLLALHRDRHAAVHLRLRSTRFSRTQNC